MILGQYFIFNPLNNKLNPICHLLTLLEAHHILHVSRIGFKSSGFENKLLRRKSGRENRRGVGII
jgi:hypothetical protein